MADLLTTDDLVPFAAIDDDKATAMIADAVATATIAAPCLASPDNMTAVQLAAAKAVLRGAVLRWNETGNGAIQTSTMGPFSTTLDTKQPRRAMFWPSELADLQKICRDVNEDVDGGAFSIDTAASPMRFHEIFFGNYEDGAQTVGAIAFDSDDYDGDLEFQ